MRWYLTAAESTWVTAEKFYHPHSTDVRQLPPPAEKVHYRSVRLIADKVHCGIFTQVASNSRGSTRRNLSWKNSPLSSGFFEAKSEVDQTSLSGSAKDVFVQQTCGNLSQFLWFNLFWKAIIPVAIFRSEVRFHQKITQYPLFWYKFPRYQVLWLPHLQVLYSYQCNAEHKEN